MHGHRHSKFFRIVAMNSKQRRDGKPIETLGVYKPRIDPAKGEHAKTVEWSVARIKYWLGVGAIPSESAVRLFTQVRTRKPFRYDANSDRKIPRRAESYPLIPNITGRSRINVLMVHLNNKRRR